MRRAVFAIPGDLETVTGGYLYEKRLLEGLREAGTETRHLQLGDSFPDPTPADHAHAVAALSAVGPDTALILDGFVFGSTEPGALAGLRAPIVGVVHHPLAREEGLDDARRAHLFRTERDNVRLASAIVVPSPHTARILVTEYGATAERITVARPGTDRPQSPSNPDERLDPPMILAVGIQHPRKGHDVLLRALADLADLDWTAVVVGSAYHPGYAGELTDLRESLGLADRVRFAGEVSVAERDALYRQASVFALATRYEGYGLVFDEALVHGLPMVSCRTGAVPDTVPPDAGLLVPPEDPEAFAAALRVMVEQPERRTAMARAALRAGGELPSWLDTARTVQHVLDGVLGRPPGAELR